MNFKKGDCIVCMKTLQGDYYLEDCVYKIKSLNHLNNNTFCLFTEFDSQGNTTNGAHENNFRKATEAEKLIYEYYKKPYSGSEHFGMEEYVRMKIVGKLRQELANE